MEPQDVPPKPPHEPEQPVNHSDMSETAAAGQSYQETPKERLLSDIKAALHDGTIQEHDLAALITGPAVAAPSAPPVRQAAAIPNASASNKLSAVEIMFYIAGIVLFAALMTMLGQSWSSLNGPLRIFLSLGIGLLLWASGYIFNRQQKTTDIQSYLENSLILTGSLCVMVGAFITSFELTGADSNQYSYVTAAITLFLLGVFHFAYDTFVRKESLALLGTLLAVAAVPTYLMGLFATEHAQPDVYSVIMLLSAGLLVYASRSIARMMPGRTGLAHPFDGLAIFLSLATMFSSMFTDYGIIWTLLLFMSIFGVFYLSIIKRNKQFLGNASFFLIIGVITVAFKYFNGMGVSVSLVVAALGLLASAAFAASINRRYFKSGPTPPPPAAPAQH